jgi:hypothetical protein
MLVQKDSGWGIGRYFSEDVLGVFAALGRAGTFGTPRIDRLERGAGGFDRAAEGQNRLV